MKRSNKFSVLSLAVAAFGFTAVTAQVSTSCGNNGDKVLVCHIPPGNPANAHTICISPNAVPAHFPGNNKHNDFLGDCFGGCLGSSVLEYSQGLQNNGTAVPADRSNVSTVLGTPDKVNAPGGFFSLGFGGYIIIQMDGFILNRPGNDLNIYETTFGPQPCANYRERAEISVSPDLLAWEVVDTICQDGSVNIGSFDFIRFVKIQDVTDPADFTKVLADGFDVDGIECVPVASGARIAGNQGNASVSHADLDLQIFPNPAQDQVTLHFEGVTEGEVIRLDVMDLAGRTVRTQVITTSEDTHLVQLNIADLNAGIYMLHVDGDHFDQMHKIIKK